MADLDIRVNIQSTCASSRAYDYYIDNSLRFVAAEAIVVDYFARLTRSFSESLVSKWTYNSWIKIGSPVIAGNLNYEPNRLLFGAAFDKDNMGVIYIGQDNALTIEKIENGVSTILATTNNYFLDVAGWYHIVVSWDTNNEDPNERIKVYVNGVRQSFAVQNNPDLSSGMYINDSNVTHYIGSIPQEFNTPIKLGFDGYMANIIFVYGQALTGDEFGKFDDDTGYWVPKEYCGIYGSNGFFLDAQDSDSLGKDVSGMENNFSIYTLHPSIGPSIAFSDQMLDTPTNNFSVLDLTPSSLSAFWKFSYNTMTLTHGRLNFQYSGDTDTFAGSSIQFSSGKWYCEVLIYDSSELYSFPDLMSYGVRNPLTKQQYTTNLLVGEYQRGDIISLSFNVENGSLIVRKNNNISDIIGVSLTPQVWEFYFGIDQLDEHKATVNFGQDSSFHGRLESKQRNTDSNGRGDFYYTPPSGHLALCTQNLVDSPVPVSSDDFSVILDSGANIKTTAESLYPNSLIWIKDRENINDHQIIDTVRGSSSVLKINLRDAETTYTEPVGNSVAWCWNAGSAPTLNTDGTISAQVSSNPASGFSIISYTGTGTITGKSVGHGLSKKPEMIAYKNRSRSSGWDVYHVGVTTPNTSWWENYLQFGDSDSPASYTRMQEPSSTVVNLPENTDEYNDLGEEHLLYCFHGVDSFSRFGMYRGNGSSSNGPFVYTGFKPAALLLKSADTDITGSWVMLDGKRSGYNPKNDLLYVNSTDAEYSGADYPRYKFFSNGFKITTSNSRVNQTNQRYIFIAFAEAPFKKSLAR